MESKNLQMASFLNGGQQTNQIKNVLEFIQKIMETLSTYERQFQGQLDIEMTQLDIEINLAKTIVCLQIFLISNLNQTGDPKKNHHTIHTFMEALSNDVDELFKHKQTLPRNNISQREKSIISEFSKQEDLVFTKADKGGATVILHVEDYIEKANKELKDENYYKRISHDPTHEHVKLVNCTIKTFHRQQVLAKQIADSLKTTNVKTPHLYITPKVHKKDIPGRPVVSSIDYHTCRLSKFVDHYLQPHTKALSSYVKDTTDFINKLENDKDTSKDSILVTLDVKALYTNIPNHDGI